MRNTFALIIALLAVLASSCSQDELLEKRRLSYIDDTEFFASFDTDSILSRTYIEEDAETSKLYLRWTKADEITIFRGNTLNQRYQYKGETGDNSAGFRQIASDDFVSYNDLDNPTNYAVYPYNENTRITEKGVLNIALPANQKYAEKSFGLGANTMVAVTQHTGDVNLLFKNVCGYFKFKFYGEDLTIRSVTLQGNNEENLAGNANVTSGYGSLPAMTMVSDTTKTLTLDCGEAGIKVGATKETATEFWFVVPPTQFTKGFTITVTDTDGGKFTKTTEKVFEIKRNTVKPISAIEVETIPDYSAMTVPDDEIWYTTKDKTCIDFLGEGYLSFDDIGLNGAPFDVNIIEHYFDGEKCIIKCDGPITKINNRCFSNTGEEPIITSIMLPNSVREIGRYCFSGTGITEFRTPDNLQVCKCPFINNPKLTKFTGKYTDGKSIIINDVLCIYALGLDCESYVIPDGVTEIGVGAFYSAKLKNVIIPEGVKTINNDAFGSSSIVSVTIPQSVEYIGNNAFDLCFDLQGYFGNSRFVTQDNMCFITDDYRVSGGKQLNAFAGHNLSSYKIPEGITSIRAMSFHYGGENLMSVTLPNSIVNVDALAFKDLPMLQYIYGPGTTLDNKGYVNKGELQFFLGKGITSYCIPEEVTSLGAYLFEYNNDIENVILHDNVTMLGMDCFANCENLKSITLSAKLSIFPFYCFKRSYNIEKIIFRNLVPPKMNDATCPGGFFPEKEYENLTIFVPNQSKEKYLNASGWEEFAKYVEGYEYTDLPELDYYVSTDYLTDGLVTTLQTATKGDGIDIVLMGDAYSDRQIADGTYKTDMEYIYNNLFTEEPYKSFKDHFNVRYVNVVSATEGYEHGGAALGGYFGEGTHVGGNDNAVFTYAQKAISTERMDEALIVVAMNSNNYAGTCYMYHPTVTGGYGNGISVSYFPKGENAETFAQLLHHEALGHGFSKLADEYAYEDMGAIPATEVTTTKEQQNTWGWWKNVDFTSDPSATRWSHFINDTRYANDGLGAYEGGLTYWTGVWRPTENSIMRYNTGGFNAPSREAIYYRIHKLAYGDSWQYDYEEFVKYDAINRKAAASSYNPYRQTNYKPLHAPVVIRKSWKDVK